jgi:hypothetical protein
MGQIYIGFVNWALMTLTLILTMVFRSSDSLAAAFGIPVSLTMLLTSVLMFIAMREVWRWSLPLSQPRWGCSSSSTAHSLRQIWRSFSRVAEYRLSSPAISFFPDDVLEPGFCSSTPRAGERHYSSPRLSRETSRPNVREGNGSLSRGSQ